MGSQGGRGQRGVVKRRPAGISRRARDRGRGVTIAWWQGALECGGQVYLDNSKMHASGVCVTEVGAINTSACEASINQA